MGPIALHLSRLPIYAYICMYKDWLIQSMLADKACKDLLEACSPQLDQVSESSESPVAGPLTGVTEECGICLDAEPEHYRPCMHRVACSSCASELRSRSATRPWCRCVLEDSLDKDG